MRRRVALDDVDRPGDVGSGIDLVRDYDMDRRPRDVGRSAALARPDARAFGGGLFSRIRIVRAPIGRRRVVACMRSVVVMGDDRLAVRYDVAEMGAVPGQGVRVHPTGAAHRREQ